MDFPLFNVLGIELIQLWIIDLHNQKCTLLNCHLACGGWTITRRLCSNHSGSRERTTGR
jgi:hypothetical protein